MAIVLEDRIPINNEGRKGELQFKYIYSSTSSVSSVLCKA